MGSKTGQTDNGICRNVSKKSTTLHIITNNHFDPTWRRCWNRPLFFSGKRFISYADLQEYYILDNLKLARNHPKYRFEVESVLVARHFLDQHPELKEELLALAQSGRFTVSGAGENIIDSNMVIGESLVRNLVTGLLWVESALGRKTRLGIRNDAFGNSAQLPQVFRKCEIAWVTGLSYTQPDADYWRGLDGSTVFVRTAPIVSGGGGVAKYPPCSYCMGTGCDACQERGIDCSQRAAMPAWVDTKVLSDCGVGILVMCPEEMLPNEQIFRWVQQNCQDCEVRFSLQEDLWEYVQQKVANADTPVQEEILSASELNPNNSGCLVTRIRTKQTCRRQEYALLEAETLSSLAWLMGGAYPRKDLAEAWRGLLFTQFHDAITATHVDAAYAELEDCWHRLDILAHDIRARALRSLCSARAQTLTVVNAFGHTANTLAQVELATDKQWVKLSDPEGRSIPVVDCVQQAPGSLQVTFLPGTIPAMSCRTLTFAPGKRSEVKVGDRLQISNQHIVVSADEHGLLEVRDIASGALVSCKGDYRPAELILEHDLGSPWATLHPDQTRHPLSEHTRFVRSETCSAYQRLIFRLDTPRGIGYSGAPPRGHIAVTLYDSIPFPQFHTVLQWQEYGCRMRVAFPVPASGKALYGIPYGTLERQPYEPNFGWTGANGDWPAINWAGVESTQANVAVLSKGLPSYRIEQSATAPGMNVLISLLRSPCVPTYLDEPQYYSMTAFEGMRDAGTHEFEYALACYPCPLSASTVTPDAAAYNSGVTAVAGLVDLPSLPLTCSNNIHLEAVKLAEQSANLIVRMSEYRGQQGRIEVHSDPRLPSVTSVNLLERNEELTESAADTTAFELRPWEIMTLKFAVKRPG